ncbi:triose-phosphate transporter family-domain-containing protein [Vararia minispora EC-137]|uniref:Triose-phosphate transporter family-domain-containing protein n=1 Tax=Vararia minispora EC-137 TaxID=1314806 RepID=A0ACB8QVE3_9AGAM|nr:triose-phosphate transporter family-domain-containing protein [Vararia minispora EC-137]
MATANGANAWKSRALDHPHPPPYRPPPLDAKPSWRTQSSPFSSASSLAASVRLRFVLLCALWYTSSALSSNTGKSIMIQFKYPVTLTFVQFGFVAAYCLLFMSPLVRFTRLRRPTKAIFKDTLPMGLFQVGGHIFSSMAISRIPVSTVHTIKALSPLFTVAAYALLFGVRYSSQTYVSLLPLTIGVMLACSFDMSASNFIGLLCAFGSAIVFVSSNIFFKRIMPTSTSGTGSSHKLDKLNLLFYSSGMAFLLMIPIWMATDLRAFLAASADPSHVAHPSHAREATHGVKTYFFLNGTVHFAQNIIAFIILASVSPVTYSIASLIKRVAVICLAIVWFSQRVHPVQAFGIGLTFFGLYLYHGAKGDVERGEKARRGVEAARDGALPLTREQEKEATLARGPPTPAELQMNFMPPTAMAGHVPDAYSSQMRSPVMSKDAFQRMHPNLHIDTLPRADPYPSPPASIDSPPLTAQLVPVRA